MLYINSLVPQALQLLVKTKMDLKAKNLDNSTALDIAATAETKSTLVRAGAKRGSSVADAPTFADKLRSKITFMDKIIIFILRIRMDISEDQRNAFLVVAALVATATYQSALSPAGGVYQANAGDNSQNTTTFNSTATNTQGTSVMHEGDFFTLSIFNTLSLLVSTMTIYILTPSGIVGSILFAPIFWFAYCYLYSMKVISPTSATSLVNLILLSLFSFLYSGVYFTFSMGYERLQRYAHRREIKTRNSTERSRW